MVPAFLFLAAGTLPVAETAGNAVARWLNPPAQRQAVQGSGADSHDPTVADPALNRRVRTTGDARFAFEAKGPHLVEIFLETGDGYENDFVLLASGKAVDERFKRYPGPNRMRPRGSRRLCLMAMIDGPAELTVQTTARHYDVSLVRWTPADVYEREKVPVWRKRLRELHEKAIFRADGGRPMSRIPFIEQVAQRLRYAKDPEVRKEALLGVTRAYYWMAAENHDRDDIGRTADLLRECLRVMPAHPIVRQMVAASCEGTVIRRGHMPAGDMCRGATGVPWNVTLPPAPPGAPEWAVTQRLLAKRMEAITRWWVEKRQHPKGELGGDWGDDVEILRNWGPEALGLGSAIALKGTRNIADGVWNSGMLEGGYDRSISDVEHSSEPTTDTQPLLAAMLPGDASIIGRLKQTAACASNWIGPQPDGVWRFHSSWFNCREQDRSPKRASDVHLNVRAMGPALWYAYFTRDRALVELLERWGGSWKKAMQSTEHGKPRGLIPSALRSADGSYLIGSKEWDKPDAEWDYYQWSGESQEAITSLFLGLHDLTGKREWLDAAGESFSVLKDCARYEKYCAEIRKWPQSLEEWQRRTGQLRPAPDEQLLREMAEDARRIERRLGTNFDMYTSEVLYTDRVYYDMVPRYRFRLFGGDSPRGERYPTFAVTWETAPDFYARAVLEAGERTLRLRFYNFNSKPVTAVFRTWRLVPGKYELAVGAERREIEVGPRPHRIEAALPAAKEIAVTLKAR